MTIAVPAATTSADRSARTRPRLPRELLPARLAAPRHVTVVLAVAEAGLDARHPAPSDELLTEAKTRVWQLMHDTEECWSQDGFLFLRIRRGNGYERSMRLNAIAQAIAHRPLSVAGQTVHVDVGVAWAPPRGRALETTALIEHASRALAARDLRPVRAGRRRWRPRLTTHTLWHLAILFLALFAAPLAAMAAGHFAGVPVAEVVFWAVVTVLAITVALQWIETLLGARGRTNPPEWADTPPQASAIVAAYLPNEQDTIADTLASLLAHDYAGGLQVILAYNTPEPLAVEAELQDLARANPRLTLARVAGSTSKAQNVNAALALVTGEFVGIFDADHTPDDGSFDRAGRWIASGMDVVQGHCVVRNGDHSPITRLVAVEFEQIYAVGHRGRQRLHGYGIFAGSNGYWRSDLLRTVRMHSNMLTEDIDSSIRAVRAGARILNDPGLISRELAPTSLRALTRQRLRWAQGWSEVALTHANALFRGDEMTVRQRAGLFFHMLWRETYPLISALMWPLLAFLFWRDGGLTFSEGGLVLMAFALSTTPMILLVTWRVADREIARRRAWWWMYAVVSMLAYQEYKAMLARVGLVKLALGEHRWVVTPRG
ncbi:glycosyltransferase family 2 protein [Microbacterium sp.]|uniref:glycosyltransferase family 2 protein n=1 Tax=Microbacterium sp. TaxID=51671 RepID=UPI003A8B6DD2